MLEYFDWKTYVTALCIKWMKYFPWIWRKIILMARN